MGKFRASPGFSLSTSNEVRDKTRTKEDRERGQTHVHRELSCGDLRKTLFLIWSLGGPETAHRAHLIAGAESSQKEMGDPRARGVLQVASSQPMGIKKKRSGRRSGGFSWLALFDQGAGVMVSAALSALTLLAADRLWRPAWDFSWTDHYRGAVVLYLTVGAILGLAWVQLSGLSVGLSHLVGARPRRRHKVQIGAVATILAAASWPLTVELFSGARVRATWLGPVGPYFLSGAIGFTLTAVMLLVWRAQSRARRGRGKLAVRLSAILVAGGASACWADMNVLAGLYPALHTLLELTAFSCFFGAFQLLGFLWTRAMPFALLGSRLGGLALLSLGAAFLFSKPLRTWTDARLAHAWVDKVYVGRVLERVQTLELELSGEGSLNMARVDQLARRFHLKDRGQGAEYMQPVPVSEPLNGVKNVIFFYVDTLRADVAADSSLMPHLAQFNSESLVVPQAYAAGSDTLRSLPAITSGNYFLDNTHQGDLLRLAKSSGVRTRLVVAKSAGEFLAKLLPSFSFAERTLVPDYDEGENVWGYGAHRSTAKGVVDEAVSFLQGAAGEEPFLLWLFHFDQHAWREIDEEFIRAKRLELNVPKDGALNVRYRVLAKSIDQQFGRLLDYLSKSGREKDTAVVFVSDHGEGLGQGGFWVHAVFLWESLVHVPLALRIPGVAPRKVSGPRSLTDIAPTLAPILGGEGSYHYHGENLRLEEEGPRRIPVLMRGGTFNSFDRIGIVDGGSKRKLVVRLEAAFPELHAYEDDPRDKQNLSRQEPAEVKRLMRKLATSPVFPRSADEFEEQGKEKADLEASVR